jgi:phage shock protein C
MLGGVCSGLGEYFDIDPTIVRLAFVALFFGAGFGLIPYIIMWIIVPPKPSGGGDTPTHTTPVDVVDEGGE